MHIALALFQRESVEGLRLRDCAKRGDGHNLRLTAGEDSAAVRTAKDADLAPNGANLILRASVGTNLFIDDLVANDFLGERVENRADVLAGFRIFFFERFHGLRLHLLAAHLALRAIKGIQRPDDLIEGKCANLLGKHIVGMIDNGLHLLLADLGFDFRDKGHDLFDFLMGKENRAEHFVLGDLICTSFHHHHRVLGSGNGEAQAALVALGHIRVDDVLTVDHADCNRTGRAGKRRFADGECCGGTDHREQFRLDILLNGENGGNHLHVIIKPFREKRTQRTVDEARTENRAIGRAAFPFDESAGNLAHRVKFFLIFYRKRQKIHAITRGFCDGGAYQHRRVAHTHKTASACLFGILAGFDDERPSAKLHLEVTFHFDLLLLFLLSSFY